MTRTSVVVLLAALAVASPAAAQYQIYEPTQPYPEVWGISVGVTPVWESGDRTRFLFKADHVNLQGSEARIGFVRGRLIEGDWGISFVHKAIDENSTMDVDVTNCSRGAAACGTFYTTQQQTRLTGLEVHHFIPFRTWRERVQLGMVGAVGVGWLRGTVNKRTLTEEAEVEAPDTRAEEMFPHVPVPLLKMEVAAAGIVAEGFKVRASGGFSMPGWYTFSVTFLYLFPR